MLSWALALALGALLAGLTYGLRRPRLPLAALRALAAILLLALLFDAPLAARRPLAPWVALDVSASWAPALDASPWQQARAIADSLRRSGADSLLLFGSALRGGATPDSPTDSTSRIGPLVEQMRAFGRPVLIVTDAQLDDPERLADLPIGSALIRPPAHNAADLAVAALAAPASVLVGDTLELRVTLRAGAVASAAARRLSVTLGGRVLHEVAINPLEPYGERELLLRGALPPGEGSLALTAALSAGDGQPANDTLSRPLAVVGTASVALISTAPDQDARFAFAVLRQTQRGALRAYWRVAPGQWREGEALRPVPEEAVRRAFATASLVLLHGDTSYFGQPISRTRGPLVLLPQVDGSDEYYATGAGDSPLRAALADLPWDALPPLRVGTSARGGIPTLLARRARRGEERAIVTLYDARPRRAVVTAAGTWRWKSRGGSSAEGFDALWGSIFDWVAAPTSAPESAASASALQRELLPRAPNAAAGPVGSSPARDTAPRARGAWWLAALALLALSAEWMLRRRMGWR
ncbi:MAG: nucleotidyltransferase domain-containing protein [Gemmatimonadaceae bacterium]|nr:nucleotidyltransferase domain-containing protein [Gemmatimonadaceae bacterium]MCW5824959.1 nucleotidyltransferase domain-containing protein [Gemmatimonadaceae bacterium]